MDIEHYLLKGILPESFIDYMNTIKDNSIMSRWLDHDRQLIREAQTEFHDKLIDLLSLITTYEA